MSKPIIFSTHMVAALLAGKKTQTRRILAEQPPATVARQEQVGPFAHFYDEPSEPDERTGNREGKMWTSRCPYGAAKSSLWVREVFTLHRVGKEQSIEYADGTTRVLTSAAQRVGANAFEIDKPRSPIFMPRWASRISLTLTGVRAERLHDIREEDAIAEGLSLKDAIKHKVPSVRDVFAMGWDDLNFKRAPWKSNPWVWVLSFSVLPDPLTGGASSLPKEGDI